MEELQERINALTHDESVRYFYHITPQLGDDILKSGLIVASKYWEESFLEFTEEELSNIARVLDENKPNQVKQSRSIILAGVYEDSMDSFIRRLSLEESYGIDWEDMGNPNYIVDSEHLIGYIDLNTLELIVNDRSVICSDYIEL